MGGPQERQGKGVDGQLYCMCTGQRRGREETEERRRNEGRKEGGKRLHNQLHHQQQHVFVLFVVTCMEIAC